eukprot:CAMPEP_0185277368 /NCGR_PEP_ID=MMETSP1359-20130426/58450_1 /TAXON_ID=552665 /ORGANISM="Bigelowiella longifila, Strain CCMP242" /LENGTH=233 /DNA_ID=CAMNT_0027871459 /DNA_START=1 /DNA_END=702 /DNA_ORIENTATION=-
MWFNVLLGEMRTQVFSWGLNTYGQLGVPECKGMSAKPLLLSDFNEFSRDEDAKVKRATAVKCGGHHTIVLTESGEAFACGCGSYGQLGLGDFKHQRSPKKIEALKDAYLTTGSCGAWHTVLLTGDKPVQAHRNKWVPFADPPAGAAVASGSSSSISSERKGHDITSGRGREIGGKKAANNRPIVPRQPRKPQGMLSSLLGALVGSDGLAMCTGTRRKGGGSKPNSSRPKYPPR